MAKTLRELLLLLTLYLLTRIIIKIFLKEDISDIQVFLPLVVEAILFSVTFFFLSKKTKKKP